METDSFFCHLLKQLPETLFELLDLPPERALAYRFDSVEVKKSFRIDGIFLPNENILPVMLVEVQFQPLATFYANLFGKVFWYLEENDPGQEWIAVAIFGSRSVEPSQLGPYEDLLRSPRVKRIYLDEVAMPTDPPLGLGLLQLVSAPENEMKELVSRVVFKAEHEFADSEMGRKAVELMKELLLRRFTQLDRKEIRNMFQLHDLRKSKVWQEAHEKGIEKGREEVQLEIMRNFLAKGISTKEIAALMKLTAAQVRRLAKKATQ
jgi:predicted transposase/invertase (TIGR01784 family)